MVARACILILILHAKMIGWVVEQPCGSRLEIQDAFQWLATILDISRITIEVGKFGGDSVKRLWLYSGEKYSAST